MKFLVEILLCLHLLLAVPAVALAQVATLKDPLAYPVRLYGFMLAVAIFGGLASWYAKVKRGEIPGSSVFHLIGEIATSAFVGLVAFFVCEYAGLPQILTAPIVGICGHLGARAIGWMENALKAQAERKAGVPLE